MARRTRHDTPKWAEAFPDTPEGMDAMHTEGEVRRHLRNNTDPDEIDDPEVRDTYLRRLQEESAAEDDQAAAGAPRRHRADPRSPRGGARRPATRFSHPLHWGSGARGHTVGRPTLRVPSRPSINDGTGFAFGLLLYALGLSYLRYGAAGPKSWLAAKFINRPTLTGADVAAAAPATTRPGRIIVHGAGGVHSFAPSVGGVSGPGI